MTSSRDRVLDAAVALFAQQGYDATSVSQVIERAGLTKGGFYHHFASKDALLYEVYGDLISGQLERMDEILARRLPPADTLRALILDLVESTAASAQRALVFWRELHRLGDEHTASLPAGTAPLPRRGAQADPKCAGVRRVREGSVGRHRSRSPSSA